MVKSHMSKQVTFYNENNAHTLECVVKIVGVRNLANSSFIIICSVNLGNLFADFHFSLIKSSVTSLRMFLCEL